MADHKVTLTATEGIFRGLAKQNMLFHQCMGELVDNAISAKRPAVKFHVEVILIPDKDDSNRIDVFVADNCKGMSLTILEKALQLGEPPATESRLNEHGFGLKNALVTLSGGNGWWKIWTKPVQESPVYTIEGPFRQEMLIRDNEVFPTDDFLPADVSTLIKVPTRLSFVQTVQGRGAPAKDLVTLRSWLIEHLGVMYRGYLLQDKKTFDTSGVIVVSIGTNRLQVPPAEVPIGSRSIQYLEIELSGGVHTLEYEYGTLDVVRRDTLVKGQPAKYYYQGNIPTQGVDIRLGKRVIATKQFETIWKTDDGLNPLSRHNNFNDFVGELIIPELPRGILSTTNNKTDFNLDDPDWTKIFDKMNAIRPPRQIREKSESELKNRWMQMLKATNPDDNVTDEVCVWPTGTYIDVYRETPQQKIIIYELKVGKGSPIHLYQLKMYWDGLILQSKQPSEAYLLVEDFDANLELMANQMNQLNPPQETKPYNFKIERHKDKGL